MDVDKLSERIIACEPRNRFLAMEMENTYTTVEQRTKILDQLELQVKREVFEELKEFEQQMKHAYSRPRLLIPERDYTKLRERLLTSDRNNKGE